MKLPCELYTYIDYNWGNTTTHLIMLIFLGIHYYAAAAAALQSYTVRMPLRTNIQQNHHIMRGSEKELKLYSACYRTSVQTNWP